MTRLIPWWLLFAAVVAADAAAERPDEFAYGTRLEADGREALYEVALPAMVYRGVAQPDLRDVRVFNGSGEVVPHAWRARRAERTEATPPVALTLFPLKAEPGVAVDGLAISVRRSAGGTTINVTSSGAGGAAEKRTVGYLVDLTGFERTLRAIELDWTPAADGFAGKLRVDGSDDLGVWRALVAAAPLVNLEVAGQRLQQKRIELPLQKVKYLRLSWVPQGDRAPLPDLTSASGELVEKSIEAPREWASVEAGKGEKPGEYAFDARGHFPVDRIRLHLPEANTVAQVELLARSRSDQPWRQVTRGVAYRLRRGEAEVTGPDLAVGVATDRYWLLRVDQRGGGLGAGAPKLEIGWVPHRVVFAARGSPPFQLAYGRRDAKPAAYAIESLIPGYREDRAENTGARIRAATAGTQQTVNVQSAQALAQTELGGEARRHEAIDWKRWSLWAALVLGVLILGVMAWRLVKQLDKPATPPSADAPPPANGP
jgi:hypothetical protein